MKKRILTALALCSVVAVVCAEVPQGYYDEAIGKSGKSLQTTLAKIINHSDPGYDALWSIYESTDRRDDGKVWDMYSGTSDFTVARAIVTIASTLYLRVGAVVLNTPMFTSLCLPMVM